jgi:uncharacterized membrane protein
VLLGYGLLLLSLTCFTLFVVNSVVPLLPPEEWLALLGIGLFLLAGAPAALFLVTPRAVGGPIGAYLRLYSRMLAVGAPTAPIPWTRYAGLYNLILAAGLSLLFAGLGGLGVILLHGGSSSSTIAMVASILWMVGGLFLAITIVALLGRSLRRDIRRWQTQQ